MKTLLSLMIMSILTSLSMSAHASLLQQISGIHCQGPNSSTSVSFSKMKVTRERFSAESHDIKDLKIDDSKQQISFIEIIPNSRFGDSLTVFQLNSKTAVNGMVDMDMLLPDGSVLLSCTGFIR